MAGTRLIYQVLKSTTVGACAGFTLGSIVAGLNMAPRDKSGEAITPFNWDIVYGSIVAGIALGLFFSSKSLKGSYHSYKLDRIMAKLTPSEIRLQAIGFDLDSIPPELCDPISTRILDEPVMLSSKQTFNRSTIPLLNGECPLTRQLLDPKICIFNTEKRDEVQAFINRQIEAANSSAEHKIEVLDQAFPVQQISQKWP